MVQRVSVVRSVSISLVVLGLAIAWSPVDARKAERLSRAELGDKPDVIVVMLDDLGHIPDDRLLKRLPNIRKTFIRNGLRLTGMTSEYPLCCPGRAAFQTGQHTLRHGVWKNDGDLLDPSKTINAALQVVGYHTFMVGKYYNFYDGPRHPAGWDRFAMPRGRARPTRFFVNGALTSFGHRPTVQVIGDIAVDWLKRAPVARPLFSWISFPAPHIRKGAEYSPFVMKRDRGAPRCHGIPRFKPPTYTIRTNRLEALRRMPPWRDGWRLDRSCESLLVVDRTVGRLVNVLKERGRDAYLILMADNGMSWGQKGFPQKNVPTSVALPFYITGPGIGAGSAGFLAANIDIAPTIMEVAGVAFPSADGTSLLPGILGQPYDARRFVLLFTRQIKPGHYQGWRGLKSERWFYVRWDHGRRELYDMRDGPWLRRDRAKRRPGVVSELDARLDEMVSAIRARA